MQFCFKVNNNNDSENDVDSFENESKHFDGNAPHINRLYPSVWSFKPDLSDVNDNLPPLDIGDPKIICSECGAYMWILERADKSTKDKPHFTQCCGDGKIRLDAKPDPPQLWKQLASEYDRPTLKVKLFREHQRKINNALAMAYCKVNFHQLQTKGAAYYRIQGKVYHLIGACAPSSNKQPAFAQIYSIDPDEQAKLRVALLKSEGHKNYSSLELKQLQTLFQELQQQLSRINPYVKQYVQAIDKMKHAPDKLLVLKANTPVGEHKRRWNLPEVDNFAIVMPDKATDPNKSTPYQFAMQYKQSEKLTFINDLHPMCDPLSFPLLFPYGTYTSSLQEVQAKQKRNITYRK